MKLFGGKPRKPGQNNNPDIQKVSKLSKKQKRVLLMFFIFAAVLFSTVAVKTIVRPPSAKPPAATSTAADKSETEEEGTELTVENMGKRKDQFFTMVIACTDQDKTRTDAIIVAAFDVKNNKINLLSVPRDTYSKVKRNLKKINSAYATGKAPQLEKELTMLLGIPIDRYAIFDFDGVAQTVDTIGGIEYNVPFRMKYSDPAQDLYIDLKPGVQKLNGEKAVDFLRWRENDPGIKGGYPDGDLGRIKAQQEFLMTLAKKTLVPTNIIKVPEIASELLSHTNTDFSNGELIWLGLAALHLNSENISMQTLPGTSKTIYEPGVGMDQSYYFPDKKEILTLVNGKFNPYLDPITDITVVDEPTAAAFSSDNKTSSQTAPHSDGKTGTNTSKTTAAQEQPPQKTDSNGQTTAATKTQTRETTKTQSSDNTAKK